MGALLAGQPARMGQGLVRSDAVLAAGFYDAASSVRSARNASARNAPEKLNAASQGGLRRFRRVLFPGDTHEPLLLRSVVPAAQLTQRLEVGLAIVHHVQGDGHGLAVAAI